MAKLTEEQIDRFLDLVTKGMDRIEAAHAVGEQASTFQILSLDDPEFRERMKAALAEAWYRRTNHEDKEVTQDVRREFLELVREGKEPTEAAHAVGGYFRHFSKLCNVTSAKYDPDFHRQYLSALEEGHPAFLARIRSLMVRAAEDGEYRAIRDMIIMYLPEGEKLSSKKIEVRDGDMEALKQAALQIDRSRLTNEELEVFIRLAEKGTGSGPHLELVSGDGG